MLSADPVLQELYRRGVAERGMSAFPVTLKQHFRALVELGTLNQHGSGRGVWYDLR